MSNDIHQILERLALIEGRTVPVTPTGKGLDPQQKDARQLPALFKPKKIQALGAKTDPNHPMKGMAVGALEEAMQEVEEDMLSKVKKDLTTYLDKLDENPAKSGRQSHHEEEEVEEDPTPSEVGDTAEPAPAPSTNPTLPEGAPVKTFTMEDGTCVECWGNERDGFELRRGERKLPTRFKDIDQADMAMKIWQARRRKNDMDQDYIEER
jgi:hypothetical protein